MNWGQKIVVMLAVFIVFILGLGYFMIKASNEEKAEDSYYEKGVNYTQEYNKKENTLKDKVTPDVSIKNDSLWVTFKNACSGKIYFTRPSNQRLDFDQNFSTNASYQYKIDKKHLISGPWRIRIEWDKYISEHEIVIP